MRGKARSFEEDEADGQEEQKGIIQQRAEIAGKPADDAEGGLRIKGVRFIRRRAEVDAVVGEGGGQGNDDGAEALLVRGQESRELVDRRAHQSAEDTADSDQSEQDDDQRNRRGQATISEPKERGGAE